MPHLQGIRSSDPEIQFQLGFSIRCWRCWCCWWCRWCRWWS